MPAVLAELEELGAIDGPTRDRLVADLKKTDPALWPQLLVYFKASLAYRHKYNSPEAGSTEASAAPPTLAERVPQPTTAADRAIDEPALLPGIPAVKPLGAARARLAATPLPLDDAETTDSNLDASASEVPIKDEAVQTVGYQTSAEPPPAAATASEPPTTPAVAIATDAAVATDATPAGPPTEAKTASAPASAAATAATKAGSPAPTAEMDPLDWQAHLKAAIRGLERDTADPPATTGAIGRHAGLRLLYLVDGDREGALRPVAGVPAAQQDFWSEQLFGLSTYLDADKTPDEARRAAAAAVHLRDANQRLGNVATLSVRNVAFATEVQSYGVYKKFDHYEFHPGQEVLLYAEVENFKTAATDQGFRTALKSSYQILDNHGARVDQKEFEVSEEHCQNPRRDYFIRYFVWMPKRIYGGNYTLQLTVEDTLSQKIGQASIDFTIAEKE
ncbi:MAG TPA: hypothetical protein VMF30_09175 [Pirellulales bacterium]|nr:hypothetical protein [Pirellulales bacterium]